MPGAKLSRLVAVLPWRMGMLNSRSCESWLLVALLVVSTTGASPMTVAASVNPPTLSAKSTAESLPTLTTMPSRRWGENPLMEISTE
jgi:hypothetical protein